MELVQERYSQLRPRDYEEFGRRIDKDGGAEVYEKPATHIPRETDAWAGEWRIFPAGTHSMTA
jgi:hypothetical protein